MRLDDRKAAETGGDSGEPAIRGGDLMASSIWKKIHAEDDSERMPPDRPRLKADELAAIKSWIEAGASYGEIESATHQSRPLWSLTPVTSPSLMPTKSGETDTNPIDRLLRQRLLENGLDFNPQADPRILVRRLSLTMLGLPPTLEQIAQFEEQASEESWIRLVDQVLSSPRLGERWGQHWLDLVRFADTNGFEMNQPRPNAWHYRDYVIRSLNLSGFTCWFAGAGVKAPYTFGATDDFGYRAIENVITVYDFHATILHLLGLDHERLTYYHNGVKRRLTDVHGKVIKEVLI